MLTGIVFQAKTQSTELPQIKVKGNQFVVGQDSPFILRGLNASDPERLLKIEHWNKAYFEEMKKWGANVVRIPINQTYWTTNLANYQATIDRQVGFAKKWGLDVILDLHWHDDVVQQQNMAQPDAIAFWSAFATRYLGDDRVLFELYNEPHDISAEEWRNGSNTWAGMQQLLDAVRATGAQHIAIIGGLRFGFDLSRPCCSSRASASRSGILLMPRLSARASWRIGVSGGICVARIRSRTISKAWSDNVRETILMMSGCPQVGGSRCCVKIARSTTLLTWPVTGSAHSTKRRVMVDPCGRQIDHQHAGARVALERFGMFQRTRAKTGGESVARMIEQGHRVRKSIDAKHAGNRPEDLFLGEHTVGVDMIKQGGWVEAIIRIRLRAEHRQKAGFANSRNLFRDAPLLPW